MRIARCFLLGLLALTFAGCAAFRLPSNDQAQRNEDRARAAESKRASEEREKLLDARAAADRSRS